MSATSRNRSQTPGEGLRRRELCFLDVADLLDPAQANTVIDFLTNMRRAVDEIDAHVQVQGKSGQAPE